MALVGELNSISCPCATQVPYNAYRKRLNHTMTTQQISSKNAQDYTKKMTTLAQEKLHKNREGMH
jgi:hypothetical protein